ncbi:MAG: class E sortase [Bifidobacteriaceae bacterium]|nr:class E sortase [Bifidobacteriaceae bacterium]
MSAPVSAAVSAAVSAPGETASGEETFGAARREAPAGAAPGERAAAKAKLSARRRRPRLPPPELARRELAPKGVRWWVGAVVTAISALALAFVAHAAVFSHLQHGRAQTLAYQDLRSALAKAEAPTGQLDINEELTPLGTPVALLEIPAIGLSEVVLEGSTASVLRGGAGHRRDSVMPGQVGTAVILGRQATYGSPFADLKSLVPGDQITLTTGQGVATYRVFALRRAGDPMPEELRSGQGRLELMTADGLALAPSGVLHIDAELVTQAHDSSSRVMAYAALPAAERAMGQDHAAWFIAFFIAVFCAALAGGVWWLWRSWGRREAWLIGLPVLLALGVTAADSIMNALPNLL